MSHFNGHSECTCGEDQPNFNDRECREFYWNRRRRTSGRQADCIIEESSDHYTDDEKSNEKEEAEEDRYRASSIKRKSVSRSSSGIGTLGTSSHHSRGQRKVSSDESRSSRCLSPALQQQINGADSDNDKDLNDNYEEEDIKEALYKGKSKLKQLGDNKFGSLKSLKKALSKKNLFKSKKKEQDIEDERFEAEPKTPVLGKYGRKSAASNQDDDFGSFTEEEEEEESYSLSDFDEPEAENYEGNYSRVDKLRNLRSRSKSYGNVSQEDRGYEERKSSKPRQRHTSSTDKRSDVTTAERKYLRQYKGDMLSSSSSEDSDGEMAAVPEVRVKGRKYSSQMKEYDYDGKDELLTDKPAMNTLKKTFTAMLSRMGSRRMVGGGQTGDTSSDNISINSRYSNALESRALADKPFSARRALSRASSVNSVNTGRSSEPGKKTFMYFSSDVGKGFIISDDEEVTGVISVMNMSRKKTKKIREKITGTITDTLKRNAKRKRSKAASDIPNFLFVNKPYFSSEESLADISLVACNPSSSPGSSLPTSKSKRYRSELSLRSPSRNNLDNSGDESDIEQYSTLGRTSKTRPRSRHSTSAYRSSADINTRSTSHLNYLDDYHHETGRDQQSREPRQRRKKTT